MTSAMHSSQLLDWETPPELMAQLVTEHGPFDLDVCATPETAKAPRYFSPAVDGLTQPWEGACYMNPPYGREIPRWVAKARAEADAGRATVVGLIPARTDTAYWHEHVIGAGAEVTFLRGRIASTPAPRGPQPRPVPQRRSRMASQKSHGMSHVVTLLAVLALSLLVCTGLDHLRGRHG